MREGKRRSVKETTEKLVALEHRFAVSQITFAGEPVWPLVRLILSTTYSRNDREWSYVQSAQTSRNKCDFEKLVESMSEGKPRSSLFWAQLSKCKLNETTAPYHRFFDSLLEVVGGERNHHQWWYLSDCVVKDVNLGRGYLVNELLSFSEFEFRSNPDLCLSSEGCELVQYWNSSDLRAEVPIKDLERLCATVLDFAKLFGDLLKSLSPRSIFLTCFYGPSTMALCLAANRLNIPVVEYQHGQQGDWHPMYTNWCEMPEDGYDLIPSVFWMWGEVAAKRVRKWLCGPDRNVVVGGNSWLASRVDEYVRRPKLRSMGEQKVVLVCLQFTSLPEFVWSAISQCKEYYWLLRLHPRFVADLDEFLLDCRERIGHDNWELERPTKEDFYQLLGEVDVQLTGWSTTCFEAVHFEVPTILVHPNGKEAMKDALEEGVVSYVDNSDDLVAELSRIRYRSEREPTIQIDKCLMASVSNEFLNLKQ